MDPTDAHKAAIQEKLDRKYENALGDPLEIAKSKREEMDRELRFLEQNGKPFDVVSAELQERDRNGG